MKGTACETKIEGRIINVASEAHYITYREGIRFDKINDQESYIRHSAYGQSKLANILSANELTKRLKILPCVCHGIVPFQETKHICCLERTFVYFLFFTSRNAWL